MKRPAVPSKPRRVGDGARSYLQFDGLLSPPQQRALQRFVASQAVQRSLYSPGTTQGASVRQRKSRIALFGRPSSCLAPEVPAWLDRKLRDACRATHAVIGNEACPLGIDSCGRWTPRFEPVQYAEYREGGHYRAWHTDADADERVLEDLRCVTVVLMLSDTEAYEGGHLEVRLGSGAKATRVPLRAGDAVGFPSKHLWHRVAECKSGLRQTLVYWARRPGGEPQA